MHCFTNYHLFYTKFDGDFKNDIKNYVPQSHDVKMTSNLIGAFPNCLTFSKELLLFSLQASIILFYCGFYGDLYGFRWFVSVYANYKYDSTIFLTSIDVNFCIK